MASRKLTDDMTRGGVLSVVARVPKRPRLSCQRNTGRERERGAGSERAIGEEAPSLVAFVVSDRSGSEQYNFQSEDLRTENELHQKRLPHSPSVHPPFTLYALPTAPPGL